MKIAVVHSFYSEVSPSGENDVVRMQVRALERAGVSAKLISGGFITDSVGTWERGKTALRVATGFGRNPRAEIESFEPDIIHLHNLFPYWGENWLRTNGTPVVTTLNNFRPLCASGTLYRNGAYCDKCLVGSQLNGVVSGCYRNSRLATIPVALRNSKRIENRPQLRASRLVIALSERSRGIFVRGGLNPKKVVVLPNFWPGYSGAPASRKNRNGWVYAGRLSEEKGIRELLDVWPRSEKLDIYGSGPLETFVASRSSEKIKFHGYVGAEEVQEALAHSLGHVFPSRLTENSPLTYAQALSVATPTITLSDNAVGDEVRRSGTGIALESLASLPRALTDLKNDEGYFERSAETYAREYSESTWVTRLLDKFHGILKP